MKITVYLKDGKSVSTSGVDITCKQVESMMSSRKKTINLVNANGSFTVVYKSEIAMIDARDDDK
jgi:hypothetical protein